MKKTYFKRLRKLFLTLGFFYSVSTLFANAAGQLNIFTWGDIIPTELVEKFEKEYDIKLTITDYDSSDTALTKVKNAANGFDAVIITSAYVPIFLKEGLLMETNPKEMSNFKNVRTKWIAPPYDPNSKYTTPYIIGFTGMGVNTSDYQGDINTSSIFLDPPPALVGKINIVPAMNEIMYFATTYVGGEQCSTDKEIMKKVQNLLTSAKKNWLSIDYGTVDGFAKGDFLATVGWDGGIRRVSALNKDIKFGFPKEGFPVWINAYSVLKNARNIENAKLFQNFLMEPEVAAMVTNYTKYANGIKGSEVFLPEDVKPIADLHISEDLEKNMDYLMACSPEADAIQKSIWVSLLK